MIFNKLFTTGWNIAYKNKNESEYTIIKNNVDSWKKTIYYIFLRKCINLIG